MVQLVVCREGELAATMGSIPIACFCHFSLTNRRSRDGRTARADGRQAADARTNSAGREDALTEKRDVKLIKKIFSTIFLLDP